MKRFAQRLLITGLSLALLVTGALGESVTSADYTVEEKLSKQLQAGSGFTGTIMLESTAVAGRESEAFTTLNPLTFDFSYIYVREDAATNTQAESRITLDLANGDAKLGATQFSLRNGELYLQSELLGDGWYAVGASATGDGAVTDSATVQPAATDGPANTAADNATNLPTVTAPTGTEPVAAETATTEPTASEPAVTEPSATDVATIAAPVATVAAQPSTGALGQAVQSLLSQTSMPGLATFGLSLLSRLNAVDSAKWDTAFDSYTTKIDLWIEGYRQKAVLGKTEDGTTTMEVGYEIPASAVKAQLKQLVMDLLSDTDLLPLMQSLLPADEADRFLNPNLQSYYFYAIDALPLTESLLIARTVSLKGQTLALTLSMPLHDSLGGAVILSYDRHAGGGDLPDENTVELKSDSLLLKVDYQTYQTLTGMTVYQGTLLRQPQGAAAFEVGTEGVAETAQKAFSASFTLSAQQTAATGDDSQTTLTNAYEITLSPDYTPEDTTDETADPTEAQQAQYVVFKPINAKFSATFASGQAKNASTSVDMALEISGDQLPETVRLTFTGKTRGKWTPDAFTPADATRLDSLPSADLNALLAQAGVKAGLMMMPFIGLPSATSATSATVEAPTPSPTPAA
ncbi:MAG TPA: hypothetical protein PKJ47_09640 [Candidatus Limiplasma sp.]|nr:hypothetical protein [Candidatus Limiplasma sp.]